MRMERNSSINAAKLLEMHEGGAYEHRCSVFFLQTAYVLMTDLLNFMQL